MGVFRHSAAALSAALGAPVALGGLALRPGWRPGLGERLGGGPCAPGGLWVHAASMGEVRAAARLVERLHAAGLPLTLSTTSLAGRDLCARLHPDLPRRLAPLDHPWCVDAALRRARPRGLVLVETELWPVWIAACERAGAPVVVVSGRISERSYLRYRRLGAWLGRTLRRLAAIGARTAEDADRFVALGADAARVSVTGDLKLDGPAAPPPPAPGLAELFGKAPVVVAGSTHPGEERAILAALAAAEARGARAALVVAPRYPQRAAEVAELARRAGRRVRLRSAGGTEPLAEGEVLVLDTLGELASLYALARIAFVGGTLVPVGGHNLLEPVGAGTPVVYGPHLANVAHVAELLEAGGAGERAHAGEPLARALAAALRDPDSAQARGDAGRRALARHRGSSERAAELVQRIVGAPGAGGA